MKFVPAALCLNLVLLTPMVSAGPTVVPTNEGQVGDVPIVDSRIIGTRFEALANPDDQILFGRMLQFGGAMPPSPEVQFLLDGVHTPSNPLEVDSINGTFDQIFAFTPASARSRTAADDGDLVAFSFAVDGAEPQTMTVRIPVYDEAGNSLVDMSIEDVPNVGLIETGVAVDNQGRVTVAYVDFPAAGTPIVKAQRFDANSGMILNPAFDVTGVHGVPDIALLDPAGNRLIVASTDLVNGHIEGNIIDFSGGTPVVLPDFQISTTAGIPNNLVNLASNVSSGGFTAFWENLTGVVGDPVNIRGRRFDANGNPVSGEFLVNTTTAGSQGQPQATTGSNGETVVAWAGDGQGAENLDVFLQVYDAAGNPIGGEQQANSFTDNFQDRPSVRFLPTADALGQPQFLVLWRDVAQSDGSLPRGTGSSYRCFSIGADPAPIFADGFESGDTSSWSDSVP